MKLSRLIAVDKDVEITGIATDSRKVQKGNLFLCLSGARYDGHDYVKEALDKGASVIVSERRLGLDNEIVLPNTRRAAASLFATWYQNPQKDLLIYGVTGTNGKTSVVEMLSHIYRTAGKKSATSGTLGAFWQNKSYVHENTTPTPETLYEEIRAMVDDGVECLFMEVSSHALALDRVSEIAFHYGVYTNLSPEHLDFHQDMERYAQAKEQLFLQSKVGVFNLDNPYSKLAYERCKIPAWGFGKEKSADFCLREVVKEGLDGSSFVVEYRGKKFELTSRQIGDYNRENSLAAVAVALSDGIDIETVKEAVSTFDGVKGRLERLYHGAFSVFIDYAHTPDALARVLTTLRKQSPRRLRVLFGCGGDRDKKKRPLMGHIAQSIADEVILTSDNARSEEKHKIIDDILAGMDLGKSEQIKVIEDRKQALCYAIESAMAQDVLLIAGKGHETYEIDKSGKHAFSEHIIVRCALQKGGWLS